MAESPAVAVCLVTYDSAADLEACLQAVRAQDYRPLEVVIVDCDSRDASVETARAVDLGDIPKIVEPLGENRGFSGGMNACLQLTQAPYVLALNADARPAPDFLHHLLERCRAHPRNAAVTGRLTRPPDADGRRHLDACGMYLTRNWRHLDRGSGELDSGQYRRAERVFGATGAATLYRRSALEDVAFPGGEMFDEHFHSYREDAELCFRLAARDWRVIFEPAAKAEHRRRVLPEGRRALPAAINRHSLKNRYLLRAYHQTPGNAVRTAGPTLIRDAMAFAWVLLFERSSFGAYTWLWRHRRMILERRRYLMGRRSANPETSPEIWFREQALPL